MGIAGSGAGAAEGLDVFLNRMLVQQELARRTAAEGESMRHNRATEDNTRAGQLLLEKERDDTNQRLKTNTTIAHADSRGINEVVTPDEMKRETDAGIPSSRYGVLKGLKATQMSGGAAPVSGLESSLEGRSAGPVADVPDVLQSAQTQGADSILNRGTEAQQLARLKEENDQKVKVGGYNHEQKTVKITDAALAKSLGKKVGDILDVDYDPRTNKRTYRGIDVTQGIDHYEKPPAPDRVLIQTGDGYMRRGDAASTLARGGEVPLADTGQVRSRRDMAGHVSEGIKQAQDDLDEAERRGLLGPLAGRTFGDFLAGKLGSTGNPEDDDILGKLKMDLVAASSGFASLHGRGGANAGIARDIEANLNSTKMSHALISGGLQSVKGWVDRYGSGKDKGAPVASDPYQDYLNSLKKK